MPFTTPPTAIVGNIVGTDYTNIFRDNDNWLNGLLPAPGQANQVPISSSTSAATWGFVNTAQIGDEQIGASLVAASAVTTAKFAAGAATLAKLATTPKNGLAQTGMVIWVRVASEIPSGWSRETNLDGRIPVTAGTTFSVTYVEGTNYGSSWAHLHSISGTTGTANTLQTDLKATDFDWPVSHQSHTHALSGNTQSGTWTIPVRAVVYARKD